jgi:hypothetical protein
VFHIASGHPNGLNNPLGRLPPGLEFAFRLRLDSFECASRQRKGGFVVAVQGFSRKSVERICKLCFRFLEQFARLVEAGLRLGKLYFCLDPEFTFGFEAIAQNQKTDYLAGSYDSSL